MTPPPFLEEGREYLVLLHRRRWLVTLCVAAAVAVAVVYNATARPLFEASVELLIEPQPPKVLASGSGDAEPGGADYYLTQYELLRGRALAEEVLRRLPAARAAELGHGPLVSPWRRLREALRPAPTSPVLPAAAEAEAFRSRVSVEPLEGSRLVKVRFRAYEPLFAAEAVNHLAAAYIEKALETQFTTSAESTRWLEQRIAEQQKHLVEAEKALQAFRERSSLVAPPPGRGLDDQALAALTDSYLAARTDRMAREVELESVRSLPPGDLASAPAVVANPVVQGLKIRVAELRDEQRKLEESLGDLHPDIVALEARVAALAQDLENESVTVRAALLGAYENAKGREARLAEEIQAAKARALLADRTRLEAGGLEREVESRRSVLRELSARAHLTGLESQLRFSNLRIVEKADVPKAPILPRRAWNYQVALFLGLALGGGLAILIGRIDDTVKTPDDVTTLLGLPFLGMVPEVSAKGEDPAKTLPVTVRDPHSAVAEAYRVVRTALIFADAPKSGRVVVVSSPNPGEGKSTTLANLAVALAQNGARVLAIDADLRRPTLDARFGLPPGPGLSEVLEGQVRPGAARRESGTANLELLCAGAVPKNPAELLGGAAFKKLVARERRHFDWVLIDAPPILAMADTPVLSALADGLVMVLWSEHTTRPELKRALEQIRGVGGKLAGVVLNKVDLKKNAYYYGHYYGEYYRRYYAEAEAVGAR